MSIFKILKDLFFKMNDWERWRVNIVEEFQILLKIGLCQVVSYVVDSGRILKSKCGIVKLVFVIGVDRSFCKIMIQE